MFLDHRTVDDKCNIIVDYHITKGNVHDSEPFINRAEYIKEEFGFDIKKDGVDSGYLTLDIKKYFIENDIFAVFGYRRYGTPKSRKEKQKYIYLKEEDVYYEKETGEVLEYKGLIDTNGYKKYENNDKSKIVRRHIHEEWNEHFRNNRLSEEGKELYKKRKERIELSFADSKNNHGYRYAMYRGIKKNQNYTWLICAAQNMKNIALKKEKVYNDNELLTKNIGYLSFFIKSTKILIKILYKIRPLEFSRGLSTL
ncbi:MAG: transposase [Bacilli bacterium]|nr:transposase [Bacilli bacterium]MDD3896030.1 transposase [Bacilli bacterium]MDD4408016.1 transposase [Bacilli bacterium]